VDRTIRLWNPLDGKEIRKLEGHPDFLYGLAWSPDGKRVASAGNAGHLFFWDAETGKATAHQKLAPGVMSYGLAWSPDGKVVAVACSDHKVYLVNVP
jgi:WD40 repeat protein